MELLILALLLTPLVIAVFAFIVHMSEYRADKKVARWRATHIYNPDQNGNYPQYFNPDWLEASSNILPGNNPYPESYLINNTQVTKLPPARPRPLQINSGEVTKSVSFLFPESVTTNVLPETTFEPEIQISEAEMVENMRRLKEKGIKQTEGIYAATGCKPGASELYDWARMVWKSLP